jgi:exodeoxyribonuclease-3
MDLRLINIYLPNGNPLGTDKFNYKIKWIQRLFKKLNELRSARIPFLIGGDFNVIPEDRDCFDPNLWRNDALYHPITVQQFRTPSQSWANRLPFGCFIQSR